MATYMNQTNSGRIIVQQTNPTAIIVQPDNERKIILKGTGGLKGETGEQGPAGEAATIAVGTTSTLAPGASATVINSGTSSAAVLDFGIPKGEKGDTGATGPANTLSIGTVQKGDTAEATITGDAPNQTLNLTLPKGDKGDTGAQGPAGAGVVAGGSTGQVLTKKSDTNYDTEWATPTTYSDFTGASSSVAGAHGLVPAPTTSDPDKFLKGDGTWGTPPGTTYTEGTGIDITGSTIAVDTSTVAMQSDLPTKTSDLINDGADNTSTYVEADELATVATSGSYNDLTNKPTIPTINRFTKSLYNSTANSWYYPIATLPIDNSGNYCSVIVDGRIGGWVDSNMAKLDLIFTNRDGYTGDTVAAAGSIKGAYSNALNLCNVVVYKQTDKSAIAYLKCDGYFTFDVEVKYFQATSAWTGNYTTSPSGTLIWSTKTTKSLEYVDQAGKISKVREIYDHFTSRPASANLTPTTNGGMFTFQATNSMTTGKPKSDSHILHLEWDNDGGWDSQLAVTNNSNDPWVAVRAQNAGTWGNWVYLLNDVAGSVKTANIDALAVTTAKIANGAVTADKIDGDVAYIDDPTSAETPTPWVGTTEIENGAVTPEKASFTAYSTTEQVVGTWIDGKPLYRRVFAGTATTMPFSVATLTNCNVKNIYGRITYNGSNYHQIGGYANANYYSLAQQNYSNYNIDLYGSSNYVGQQYELVAEYTKTTD